MDIYNWLCKKRVLRCPLFRPKSDAIELVENLDEVKLSNRNLSSLPEFISKLSNLRFIYAFNNKLLKLPDSITELSNLQQLNVSHNKLTRLPRSFEQLQNLTTLNIAYNELSELPETIGHLTNLTTLNAKHNKITHIPDSIGQISTLRFIWLSDNQISYLPLSMNNLSQLDTLDVDNNKLKTLLNFTKSDFNNFSCYYNPLTLDTISQELLDTFRHFKTFYEAVQYTKNNKDNFNKLYKTFEIYSQSHNVTKLRGMSYALGLSYSERDNYKEFLNKFFNSVKKTKRNIYYKNILYDMFEDYCKQLNDTKNVNELKGMAYEFGIDLRRDISKPDLCATVGAHVLLVKKGLIPVLK